MKKILEKLKEKKKLFIKIIGVLIALLLIGVILSLVFNDKKVEVNGLSVTYIDGDIIKIKKVTDEYSYVKEVIIENTNKEIATYSLNWKDVENTFKNQSNLLYEIVPTQGTKATLKTSQIPVASSKVFSSVLIRPNETHKYEIRITYKGKSKDEKESMFTGRVLIDSKSYKEEKEKFEKELEKQMKEDQKENDKKI